MLYLRYALTLPDFRQATWVILCGGGRKMRDRDVAHPLRTG